MHIMANCPAICEQVDLPLCPAAVFFSALSEIDDAAQAVPADVRHQALRLTAEELRGSNVDFQLELAEMTERLHAKIYAGELAFVTPVALLKASSTFASAALEAGFRGVGLSLDIVLNRIERNLPAYKLADEAPVIPQSAGPSKYAVVIEGPGSRDTRNRYPTLAQAEYAVELLEATLKGVKILDNGPRPSIFYSRPPEFEKATRIYVEEIQTPADLFVSLTSTKKPAIIIRWPDARKI